MTHDRRITFGDLGRALPPVLVTYALAAAGCLYGLAVPVQRGDIPLPVGAGVILLFTVTHAVGPVFFYRRFAPLTELTRYLPGSAGAAKVQRFAGCFLHVHMGFWYGVPTLALAAMTGGFSLLGFAVHWLLAPRGTRTWVFLQYGSTSFALLLFTAIFSPASVFPWGLAVVAFQSALLTVMEVKGRAMWVGEGSEGGPP